MLPLKANLPSLQVAFEVFEAQDKSEACENVNMTLSPEQADQVKETHMSHMFSRDSTDLGNTIEITHKTLLMDDIPIGDLYRRVPPAQLHKFRVAVQDLSEAGVIRKPSSPYPLRAVGVQKKDGRL